MAGSLFNRERDEACPHLAALRERLLDFRRGHVGADPLGMEREVRKAIHWR
jgi:hypothetical protein